MLRQPRKRETVQPRPSASLRTAARSFRNQFADPLRLEPMYLRRPEAGTEAAQNRELSILSPELPELLNACNFPLTNLDGYIIFLTLGG